MQVAVDRAAIVLSYELCRLELELEAADHVDVQRVEIAEQRLEPEPAPRRNATGESLASTLVAVVTQLDAIVRVGHCNRCRIGRDPSQRAEKPACLVDEIVPDAHERDDLPLVRQRGIQRR